MSKKHRSGGGHKTVSAGKPTRPRARPACDSCGEPGKLHRVRLAVDGKPVAKWRCCTACAGQKMVALFGRGPSGTIPTTPTPLGLGGQMPRLRRDSVRDGAARR